MSVVRLARAATGRPLKLKFDGCYHGHADALLAAAGSGVATLGLPDSPGITPATVAEYAGARLQRSGRGGDALRGARRRDRRDSGGAGGGKHGGGPPVAGFFQGLRNITHRHNALLIFDEVMTGWRVSSGAQVLYGVTPDLTCLGKVSAAGFRLRPTAAPGLMELIAPAGPVYQAGTLSGNPIAMAAGLPPWRSCGSPGCGSVPPTGLSGLNIDRGRCRAGWNSGCRPARRHHVHSFL